MNDFYNPLKLNFYSNDNTKICDLDLEMFNTDLNINTQH